jgi:hypothetical protein
MRKKDICEVKKGGVYMSDQNSGFKMSDLQFQSLGNSDSDQQ